MKASATLGGVPLASSVTWRLQTGAEPYRTILTVHKSAWEGNLEARRGVPLDLVIQDGRGFELKVEHVYILHVTPSDSPHRVSFVVADRRWRWEYKVITRDYNVPKRTGTIFAPGGQTGPVEILVTVDEYQYRGYSLTAEKKRWTAKQAVEDVLRQLDEPDQEGGVVPGNGFEIESFPIESDNEDGQFTLQNVLLRDRGDIALTRLLGYIPGAQVYVDTTGKVVVFDGADLEAAEELYRTLPPTTWDGDFAQEVKRNKIRPSSVLVHYQREVEVLLDFSDDYSGGTSAQPGRNTPFLENVLPTVDPETEIPDGYDPETNQTRTITVRAGTWVPVDKWLEAMDAQRNEASLPWTFETISKLWMKGNLEARLGVQQSSVFDTQVALRVAALRQHFRQTFRINRRYVERVRDIKAVRVGLLDPVTGARAPATVWGQACIVPDQKAWLHSRYESAGSGVYVNCDFRPQAGSTVNETSPGPASIELLDDELGIFRVNYIDDPFGMVRSWVPCRIADESGQAEVAHGDLEDQADKPMGVGFKIQQGVNGLALHPRLSLSVMLSIVPAAPNNRRQFHQVRVRSEDVADVFRTEFRIQGGSGPVLHVFVPPGEASARFKWSDDQTAAFTVSRLLGLDSDDPNEAGIDEPELEGFVCINQSVELLAHARAVAAEALAPFADSLQGKVTTRPPEAGLRLAGNLAGASVHVAAAPSAKVIAIHEFPGQQTQLSRLAVLPDSARQIILGTLPLGR